MSSSDSECLDNPKPKDTPRSKRKIMFYGSDAKKASRVRREEESDGDELGDISDISVDDSDGDPDYRDEGDVDTSVSTVASTPVNIGASTSQHPVQSTPVAASREGIVCGSGASVGGGSGGRGKIVKKGRRRERNEAGWIQKVARNRRQSGLDYESYTTKKTVPKRVPGQPCKDGCFDRVGADGRAEIFKNCWDIGSYDGRLNYLNACLSEKPHKRKYTKQAVSLRPMRIAYSVKCSGRIIEVCRAGFQAIHGMTDKEMTVFLRKRKQSATGPLESDKRGRHPPARKIVGSQLDHVHEHIRMLSVTTSHYSRIKNPHRQYAPEGLSIPLLHFAYVEWMIETYPDEPRVKFTFYKKIFTSCYNIAFKRPETDVCNTCTAMKNDIKRLEGVAGNEDELDDLKSEYEAHLSAAREAQDFLRRQKDDTNDDQMVIAVDLQQTLPCPKLSVNRAYYTRKVWLYNLCVYDVKAKKPTMYVWDESQGGRGADDVASCIHRWLRDNANGRRKLRIFCDNCAAQNKNKTIVMMALQKIHLHELIRVEFVYLVSGHSYLPCDRTFGIIEKRLRTVSTIEHPTRYVNLIKARLKEQPTVTVMKIADFLEFSVLEHYCTWRTPVVIKGAF